MTEAEQRQAVVAEARSWIGTPYHHRAGIKGVGVDCAMLLVRVFCDTGMLAPFDPGDYPPAWHLHQTEERYVNFILSMGAREITEAEALPADIVVWKIGHCYAHGCIISGHRGVVPATGWPWVVHANMRDRLVDEANAAMAGLGSDREYPRRFFSLWGAAA